MLSEGGAVFRTASVGAYLVSLPPQESRPLELWGDFRVLHGLSCVYLATYDFYVSSMVRNSMVIFDGCFGSICSEGAGRYRLPRNRWRQAAVRGRRIFRMCLLARAPHLARDL